MPTTKRQRQNLNTFGTKRNPSQARVPCAHRVAWIPAPAHREQLSGCSDAASIESGHEIARVQSGALGLFSKQTAEHPIPSHSV